MLLLGATPAMGADKPFSLVISNPDGSTPATLSAAEEGTLVATYENLTSQQQLGSSDLVVPSALPLISASVSSGSASVSGNTIRLRDLRVAPGGTAVVTIRVSASCAAQTLIWDVPVTKQANNFKGPPGNDLNIDLAQSDLRTVVTGGCALRFRAQPRNARVDQTITNTPYDPAGPPVAVEVIDSLGQPIPAAGVPVSISLGANPGGGTLTGTTSTTTSNTGVASFSTLKIDRPGQGYTLVASNTQAGSVTSDRFNVDEFATLCTEDVDCSGTLLFKDTNQTFGGNSKVDVTAIQGPNTDIDTGFLTLSRSSGLDCTGYTELISSSDVVTIDFTALDRQKRAISTIDKKVMNTVANNGASFLESCFGAPYTFATKPGTPLEVNADYVPGPYPAPEYKGLLPDCGGSAVVDDPNTPGVSGPTITNAGAPCVEKRNKTGSGDGVIQSLLPSGRTTGNGDPRLRS
jgi:hypothetical protein